MTLYAITREHGPEIALLALTCRVVEAVPGEGTIFFAVEVRCSRGCSCADG
ncbi:MAG TPA: hypothetical protein VGQ76_16270 [Thermoanaerobaculia bacterium]|nr:hypothetical protein [Thermoanaerobaculia bacterium]